MKIKLILWIAALLCIPFFLISWHFVYRATSPSRAVDIVFLAPTAPAAEDQTELRVIAFNIAHGRGLAKSNWDGGLAEERQERLDDIAALLRGADADVVVLNEVDFTAPWSGGIDQAEYLARAAGYSHVARQRNIDVALPFYKLCFGNAVLSRLPLTEVERVDLPAYSRVESFFAGKKNGMLVHVDAGALGTVGIVAVHLEHRDESTRVQSAKIINEFCDERNFPIIAAGDFNSHPSGTTAPHDEHGRNAIDVFLQPGLFRFGNDHLPTDAAWTFPSNKPEKTLDWIFVSGKLRVVSAEPIESQLSDHLPILSVLTISGSD